VNFYNLDMHISIIHDVKTIFAQLGHEVTSDNLSRHTWVNGEKTTKNKVINLENFRDIDEKICEKFYKKYRKKLANYDAFVHSYPPVFALLFERFEKPIITIACTRFDFPVKEHKFEWYKSRLQEMKKSGQLIPVANNLLDKRICEDSLHFEWKHISSLCNYMRTGYSPSSDKFLLWTRSHLKPEDLSERIEKHFSIGARYDRQSISQFTGVIHIPYNLSIMSAFEQYYQNIPMLFPSIRLQQELWSNREDMLTEILFPESNLEINPSWVGLADWYDDSNMSDIVYFDSLDSIDQTIQDTDFEVVSSRMQLQNELREEKIMRQWEELIGGIS
jgi:hypothetical protein